MALHPCPHCGHPISEKAAKCPACGQNPHFTPEQLAAQTEAKKTKRKRALSIVIPSAVLITAVVLAALFLLPDFQCYQNAKKQMDAGDYISAAENFDALGEYLSAADLSLRCKAQVINTCAAPDSATASRFATALVSGGYQSSPGAIPGTTVWYQGKGLASAQSQQQESAFCMVEGCTRERLTGSFACMTHACRAPDCKMAVVSGTRYCVDHRGLGCAHFHCNEKALTYGGYCEFHQRNSDERVAALSGLSEAAQQQQSAPKTAESNPPTNENNAQQESPAQQEPPVQQPNNQTTIVTTPDQQPENSAQQQPDNPPESTQEPAQEPDNNTSGQERKVRIYNSETGQWEWVSPDAGNGSTGPSTDTTTENPHKDQIYCRHYDSETGTWVWGWVDK